MAFEEVVSLDADVTIAIGKKDKSGKAYPKSAEGYYLGSRAVTNKRGESKLHFLQTEAGNLGVWGTTDLNRKLAQVVPGTMVLITSTGTKPTPNGDMYTYSVKRDPTNTIDVRALEAASDTDASDEGFTEEETNDESDADESQTLALAAAERKAKVEALLARGKMKSK